MKCQECRLPATHVWWNIDSQTKRPNGTFSAARCDVHENLWRSKGGMFITQVGADKMTRPRIRVSRDEALRLHAVLQAFGKSYASSPVAIDEDLEWWGTNGHNGELGKSELSESYQAILAAIPELRKAAREVLAILGDSDG